MKDSVFESLSKYDIVLASGSPRRQELLRDLGLNFRIDVREVEEVFPDNLSKEDIPVFLAKLKAKPFRGELTNEMIITSDTIVYHQGSVLGKPKDHDDAVSMLRSLSGCSHEVITGVCLTTKEKEVTFSTSTEVHFKALSREEIEYYITHYAPFDKAGAYGIQEWIGFIGVERIRGSYFNVMGLPVQRLYEELMRF